MSGGRRALSPQRLIEVLGDCEDSDATEAGPRQRASPTTRRAPRKAKSSGGTDKSIALRSVLKGEGTTCRSDCQLLLQPKMTVQKSVNPSLRLPLTGLCEGLGIGDQVDAVGEKSTKLRFRETSFRGGERKRRFTVRRIVSQQNNS